MQWPKFMNLNAPLNFYEKIAEEKASKQIAARISLDSTATTIENVIHSPWKRGDVPNGQVIPF